MTKLIPIFITLAAAGLWVFTRKRLSNRLSKHNSQVSPDLAREVLGIKGKLTEDKINSSYKKLIKKLHPDADGSDFLAKQVNEARNVLLKEIDSK